MASPRPIAVPAASRILAILLLAFLLALLSSGPGLDFVLALCLAVPAMAVRALIAIIPEARASLGLPRRLSTRAPPSLA